MDHEAKTDDTIDWLASELDEVEWFGRNAAPIPVGPLDQLLVLMGGRVDHEDLRQAS